MTLDETAAWIALAAFVGAVIWMLTRPHKPLSDKDDDDFDFSGEW